MTSPRKGFANLGLSPLIILQPIHWGIREGLNFTVEFYLGCEYQLCVEAARGARSALPWGISLGAVWPNPGFRLSDLSNVVFISSGMGIGGGLQLHDSIYTSDEYREGGHQRSDVADVEDVFSEPLEACRRPIRVPRARLWPRGSQPQHGWPTFLSKYRNDVWNYECHMTVIRDTRAEIAPELTRKVLPSPCDKNTISVTLATGSSLLIWAQKARKTRISTSQAVAIGDITPDIAGGIANIITKHLTC